MAGFRTHIGTSTALGIAYGAAGYWWLEYPVPSCVLAGGLCSVSGMLPDIDSDSGVPLRESIAFTAAVVPMMMVHRFEHLGWAAESIVLAGAVLYVAVRFGLAWVLKNYTVHRGMLHSIPAALIAAQLAFLLCTSQWLEVRIYKAAAVLLGFMSHLLLDELYSVQWKGGRWQFKRSFGTAVKLWGRRRLWSNVAAYAALLGLTYLSLYDPGWMKQAALHAYHGHGVPLDSQHWQDEYAQARQRVLDWLPSVTPQEPAGGYVLSPPEVPEDTAAPRPYASIQRDLPGRYVLPPSSEETYPRVGREPGRFSDSGLPPY